MIKAFSLSLMQSLLSLYHVERIPQEDAALQSNLLVMILLQLSHFLFQSHEFIGDLFSAIFKMFRMLSADVMISTEFVSFQFKLNKLIFER